MEKTIQLKATAKVDEYTTDKVVAFSFDDEALPLWTSGLCMLDQDLVNALRVEPERGNIELRIVRVRGRQPVPLKSDWAQGGLTVELSQTELERWLHFFLSYLRDGYADVDHLDVETQPSGGRTITLVLKVPRAAAPASAAEAKRSSDCRGA